MKGTMSMQLLLRDVFSTAVIKARENDLWSKLSPSQLEELVSKCLLEHYMKRQCVQWNKHACGMKKSPSALLNEASHSRQTEAVTSVAR
jgi:hypothetical protein